MISPAVEPAEDTPLGPIDELRAQYVACSYLATACRDALIRFPAETAEACNDAITQRALEFMLAVEWDWQLTLQALAERVGKATSVVSRYNPEHAEDSDPTRKGAAHHRANYRRRPSVRRRL